MILHYHGCINHLKKYGTKQKTNNNDDTLPHKEFNDRNICFAVKAICNLLDGLSDVDIILLLNNVSESSPNKFQTKTLNIAWSYCIRTILSIKQTIHKLNNFCRS